MDDIWIISWFNHTAFDANPILKSPRNLYSDRNCSCYPFVSSCGSTADSDP